MNVREQLATIVDLWRGPKHGVIYATDYEDLVDTLLHFFHRNGTALLPKGSSPMSNKLERVTELTEERKAISVRLEAIDDEIADLMKAGAIDIGAGLKIVREDGQPVTRTPNAGSRKKLTRDVVEGFIASWRTSHSDYPGAGDIARHFECSYQAAMYHLQGIKAAYVKTAS